MIIVKAVSGLTAEQSLPSAPTMTLRTGAITPWSRPEHSTASLWVQKLFSSADTEINTRRVAFIVTRGYNGMIGIRLCLRVGINNRVSAHWKTILNLANKKRSAI